jgi:hypothetical protein
MNFKLFTVVIKTYFTVAGLVCRKNLSFFSHERFVQFYQVTECLKEITTVEVGDLVKMQLFLQFAVSRKHR